MAALIASSASMEQWSLTGGRLRWAAISLFVMTASLSMLRPLTHSLATELDAIAYNRGPFERVGARAAPRGRPAADPPAPPERTRRARRAAAERLEFRVDDVAVVVDLDLQLHDVAAGRGADEARADARVVLVHGPDVEGLLEVVDDLLVVGPRRPAGPGPPGGDRSDAAQGQHGATRRAGAREASGRGRGETLGEEP